VLATTDSEKVPATIISRTQHYDFRRPHIAELVDRLQKMAKNEGVALDNTGARLIALAAEGSFRDSESILGQIMSVEDKSITAAEVEEILGLPRRQSIKKLFELIVQKDAPSALQLISELSDAGYDLQYVQKLLLQYYRAALFLKADPKLQPIIAEDLLPEELESISTRLPTFAPGEISRALATIFDNMQRFRKTPIPQLPLELTVLELIGGKRSDTNERR
jgi:DNA polymerase-3 subunit gamma/tau